MKKNQLYLAVGLVLVIILAVVGFFVYKSMTQKSSTDTPVTKNRIREEINVLPVNERPIITLEPTSDGLSVALTISQLKKSASEVEYELEYQAGTLLQGAFGQLQLSPMPATTKIKLGTCSAGGACTYHKDVRGGKLLTRFQGANNYTLKSDWRYIENKDKSSDFSSQDAKLQLSGNGLSSVGTAIIFNAPGYPDGLTSEPVADIYNLSTTTLVKGNLSVSIRINDDQPAKLAYYDGQKWSYVTGTLSEKTLTADAPAAQFYTAVAQ